MSLRWNDPVFGLFVDVAAYTGTALDIQGPLLWPAIVVHIVGLFVFPGSREIATEVSKRMNAEYSFYHAKSIACLRHLQRGDEAELES